MSRLAPREPDRRSTLDRCLVSARKLDSLVGARDTRFVLRPGASRQQIAHTLNAAYADGLLSMDTFCRRLDQLSNERLIDPLRLIGDLNLRSSSPWRVSLVDAVAATVRRVKTSVADYFGDPPLLLALDWSGGQSELVVGRHPACDVVLSDPGASRRHARLFFRDGNWLLQDLRSTNGTIVNGVSVGRCELRPGDHLLVGDEHLMID
jgi:FHA domain